MKKRSLPQPTPVAPNWRVLLAALWVAVIVAFYLRQILAAYSG